MHWTLNKYKNRKYYAKELNHYTTLEKIAKHVEAGGTIKVTLNALKVDITDLVLFDIKQRAERAKYIQETGLGNWDL